MHYLLIFLFYLTITQISTQYLYPTQTADNLSLNLQQQILQQIQNWDQNAQQYENNTNCTLPVQIACPPPQYCVNSSLIIMLADTEYNCTSILNIIAPSVQIQGGNLLTGLFSIEAEDVSITNLSVAGNLTIIYNSSVYITSTVTINGIILILPSFGTRQVSQDKVQSNSLTQININNSVIVGKKILLQAYTVNIINSNMKTTPYVCLYEVMNIVQFNITNLLSIYQSIINGPINFVLYGQKQLSIINSNIYTTIFVTRGYNSQFINSVINTTAASCLTNLGLGKGLSSQLSDYTNCSSGGSSVGYGALSNFNCSFTLTYFMFLSHSFPYLSIGPYLGTGSGGYGYTADLGNQGAGGGIISLFTTQNMYTYQTKFLASGGRVNRNDPISAGSAGTLFLYTNNFTGSQCVFQAAGGASFNGRGSGAGGIVKISFQINNTDASTMFVNVSAGYQTNQNTLIQNNGIFYGPICPPGQKTQFLTCKICQAGTYNLLGDTLCQTCPKASNYEPNDVIGGNSLIYCFNSGQQHQNNFFSLAELPKLSFIDIGAYVVALIVTVAIGLLIKKYYKKKLTVMQTQSFSLQDAKKDVQQSRILTQRLKSQRNIKFEDLMYHIHRITLFGSNNPQCPWGLPQFPPQQIKKYILRQGFIDFSIKFNKVGKWTKLQKFISNILYLIYPLHWYHYDKIKKSKYKKLLLLLEQAKQFNLINNYDFQDKNMVTIKISKNTDYTICYLDFMVYDRADTKYFNLNSPFIISISGQGTFLRPFYLEDRDVFFNSLFYIINKAKSKIQQQQYQQDAKKQLFTNLFSQKKKQQNRNKLIDFLKNFNTISITLDLAAPLSTFITKLIQLIQFIAHWNQTYFKQLSIQLDLILMISKVKKGHVVSNQIHILTNKNPQLFKQFMNKNLPKMNRYEKYDLKLGLFVYNPDQEVRNLKNRKTTMPQYKKTWTLTDAVGSEQDQQQIQQHLIQNPLQLEQQSEKKSKFLIIQNLVRLFGLVRYFIMTHRKLKFDKDLMKFFVTAVILFQCMLACVWSFPFQFPYIFANLVAPFIGILWMVSGSYGIGKLFLIFNAMALLDQIVQIILVLVMPKQQEFIKQILCECITLFLRILIIPLAGKFLSVSRKLSTSNMFK